MNALDTLALFFPQGRGVTVEFYAISGHKRLRWAFPANFPKVDGALRYWSPYGVASKFMWRFLRFMIRNALAKFLPNVDKFDLVISDVSWTRFGWCRDEDPVPLFYFGTSGPQQKLIMQLLCRDTGAPEVVVKFPLGVMSWAAISREFDCLSKLPRKIKHQVPEALKLDTKTQFSSQRWVGGEPSSVNIDARHVQFLAKLKEPNCYQTVENICNTLADHAALQIRNNDIEKTYKKELKCVRNSTLNTLKVPMVRVHGDFVPWNIKEEPREITVLDWEDSRVGWLPFYDLYYYQARVKRLLKRDVLIPWIQYEEALLDGYGVNEIIIIHRLAKMSASLDTLTINE